MPEKSSNEIPRSVREQFDKGMAAFHRQNYEYAMALFNQVLQSEPAYYECREVLRVAQFKKAGAGQGFFRKFLGAAGNQPMLAKGQIALRSNPREALAIAEQILNGDPHSMSAHKLLADAALAAEFPRTAILSLEIIFKHSPKDHDIVLKLGDALAKAGQVDKAERIVGDLHRANPDDVEIAQALKNVSAYRTLKEGGYDALADGKGSYRDILRNKEEAVALEQEHREVKTDDVAERLVQEYQARLEEEPNNLKWLRNIAELYTQKKDFDRALDYYQRMVETEGGHDSSLERAIAETVVKKYDHALSQLDPRAPDFAGQSARLTAECQEYRLTECRLRSEKFPTDLSIRFELGQLYFDAGKVSEAIQEFQRAQSNPHLRIQALHYLGQCFTRRGMFDMAARTLQNAIKEKIVFDDEKKELIYTLGCVLERMEKREEAIEQFKQIYEIDIGYKDVAGKVDAYYGSK